MENITPQIAENSETNAKLDWPRNKWKKGQAPIPPIRPGRPKLTPEMKLIRQAAKEAALQILETAAPGAAKRVIEMSKEATKQEVKLAANKDILDRVNVGVKIPITAVQINFNDEKKEYA